MVRVREGSASATTVVRQRGPRRCAVHATSRTKVVSSASRGSAPAGVRTRSSARRVPGTPGAHGGSLGVPGSAFTRTQPAPPTTPQPSLAIALG